MLSLAARRAGGSDPSKLTASAPTVNTEGHDAYLLGRYFFNRPSDENLRKAIAQFESSSADQLREDRREGRAVVELACIFCC